MAKLSTEELLDQFKELTLIELSEFVKAFEETFDVTAAAPVAVAAAGAPAGGAGDAAAEEEEHSRTDELRQEVEPEIDVLHVDSDLSAGCASDAAAQRTFA